MDQLGHVHVGHVPSPQVDLRGGARALDDHYVVRSQQALQIAGYDGWGLVADEVGIVLLHRAILVRPSLHDDLGGDPALGLQEDGVEFPPGPGAGRPGLELLDASDLLPPLRDHRVERHVLGFEGGDGEASVAQGAAERGDHEGLPGPRGRSQDHDRLGPPAMLPLEFALEPFPRPLVQPLRP